MIKKNVNVKGIKEKIVSTLNDTDSVYFFNSGNAADFIKKAPSYNPTQFNVFGIYDSDIFNLYKEIVAMLKNECLNKEVSFNKSEYYISSDYFNGPVNKKFIYDFGGIGIPSFNGLVSLQKEEIVVYLNKERESVTEGTALLFEAGQEIQYESTEIECIYFNIAPVFMLQNQYPLKWIPIGV
jgi:hypothetical protein